MSDTLMVSVSGVRGIVGRDLTPALVDRYAAAFGTLAREAGHSAVVLARDARTSGPMFAAAASAALQSVGCRVIDCGLIPTPTAQLAVEHHHAGGGIVLTASHNPIEWNALKFVGPDGLFLDQATAARLRALSEAGVARADWAGLGTVTHDPDAVGRHLELLLALEYVDVAAIRARKFHVALDCVRGAGGTVMPALLERLGCTVTAMDTETDGRFPRAPEPVPANLGGLGALVRTSGADVGIAVDPDVDRLALVDETGTPIGEDYTLAFAVETVLRRTPGPVVVNLSTSLVVDDAARDYGVTVGRAPVGEANVARAMRDAGAVVGGEGNGGVILPALHFGRDAPLAAALVLDLLASGNSSVAQRVAARPRYTIVKAKAPRGGDVRVVYQALGKRFADATTDRQDGLRLAWADRWLHVRPSGTEPIVRLIAEARAPRAAEELVAAAREVLDDEGAAAS
ncbi:MAG TPA: phosphoglucosamine mutase [Gemmatimonadales bacterium]|nr:phosphoglucosamine mutase [Gemmatimonadales bacterium]